MQSVIATTLVTFVASTLPLLSHTGRNLEYEYTLLTSVYAVLLLPLLGLKLLPVKRKFAALCAVSVATTLPGWLMFLWNSPGCSQKGFLFWSLFNAIPATFFAFAFFDLLAGIDRQSRVKKVIIYCGTLTVLGLLTLAIL